MTAFLIIFALSACATQTDSFRLKKITFSDIPGWETDQTAQALPALMKSCGAIIKQDPERENRITYAGTAKIWQDICEPLSLLLLATDDEAQRYFEKHFTPYAVYGHKGRTGLFTGYYVPLLRGAAEKRPPYLYPLYARPDNLLTANLGDFHEDLDGKKITGRVDGEKFIPYHTRAEIDNGALKKETPIVWVDDPIDVFFLHIQGSGQIDMADGRSLQVGYAAQNGHGYTAIGKELIERSEIAREDISMQAIRQWLAGNPDDAQELMHTNKSYIFFRELGEDGVLGAQGVTLTPARSLAVDRKKIPYGAPVWIDTEDPDTEPLQKMMIAQDTGGAIKGAVRGDYFWGAGATAADKAGRMKSKGKMVLFLPKALDLPKDKQYRWWHWFILR